VKSARQLFADSPPGQLTKTSIGLTPFSAHFQVERFINIIPESIFVNFYLSFDEALGALVKLL
jgi:hypothetical protein